MSVHFPGPDYHHVHLGEPERLSGPRLPLRPQDPHHTVPAAEERDNAEGQGQPVLHGRHGSQFHLLTRYANHCFLLLGMLRWTVTI